MDTNDTKKKKFKTVDQIYSSYITNYLSSKNSAQGQNNAGAEIAKRLLAKFQNSITPKVNPTE